MHCLGKKGKCTGSLQTFLAKPRLVSTGAVAGGVGRWGVGAVLAVTLAERLLRRRWLRELVWGLGMQRTKSAASSSSPSVLVVVAPPSKDSVRMVSGRATSWLFSLNHSVMRNCKQAEPE